MPLGWVDPFAAALALRHEPGLVLLESSPGFGHLARRSFLAARPVQVASEGFANLRETNGGWWAGWLSYDLGREIERLPSAARDDMRLPHLALGRYESHLEFDHVRSEVHIRGNGESQYLAAALEGAARAVAPHHRPLDTWTSSMPAPVYECAVQRAIEYVETGDVFQVNLAQRLSTPWSGDPFALYGRLRATSPAPFMALARIGGVDVISASPERFLRRRGAAIETRPIKGTRPRGSSSREDRMLARALRTSVKDRAENVMIADLARNDLGRIAKYGSVRVRRLAALERHPGLHHLVSVVEAELAGGVGPAEIIHATFPPGSVTGAPKIRAMEIIEELEPVRRGVYCGGIGWIGPDGDLELSVAIRTFVAGGGRLGLHVGGAVVADSEPQLEWQETMHKAARLLAAAGGELRATKGGRSSKRTPRAMVP